MSCVYNLVYIDTEKFTFNTLNKTPVLQLSVKDEGVELTWLDPAWQHWEELTSSPEFKDLLEKANNRLKKASPKGMGKGKEGKQ